MTAARGVNVSVDPDEDGRAPQQLGFDRDGEWGPSQTDDPSARTIYRSQEADTDLGCGSTARSVGEARRRDPRSATPGSVSQSIGGEVEEAVWVRPGVGEGETVKTGVEELLNQG